MGLLDLIAGQLSTETPDPVGIEALQRRAAELANAQRAMGGSGVRDQGSGVSGIVDPVAKRLALVAAPAVAGPTPDAVESAIAAAGQAVLAPVGFRPQLFQAAPAPIEPAVHPAVKKRLAQITDPDALAELQRARAVLAPPSDQVALEPSAVPNQPFGDRRLFPTDVTEPARDTRRTSLDGWARRRRCSDMGFQTTLPLPCQRRAMVSSRTSKARSRD